MGDVARITHAGGLRVIQGKLDFEKVMGFAESYFREMRKVIVPVRRNPFNEKELILLDGHSRAAVTDTLNKGELVGVEFYAWIAKHKKDYPKGLPREFFPQEEIKRRNYRMMFQRNYCLAPEAADRLENNNGIYSRGTRTIEDLKKRIPYLDSDKELINYFKRLAA